MRGLTIVALAALAAVASAADASVTLMLSTSWGYGWKAGDQCMPAFVQAIEDINANSDILPNTTLNYVWDESGCARNIAMRSVMRLQEDWGVDVVIGPPCSVSAVPIGLMATVWNIPMVSWAAGSVQLSNKDDFPLFTRTVGAYGALALPYVKFVQTAIGVNRINLLATNDALWLAVSNTFESTFSANNITIDTQKIYEPVTATTLGTGATFSWMQGLLEQRARVIVNLALCANIREVMISAKRLNMLEAGWAFISPEMDGRCYQTTDSSDSENDNKWFMHNMFTSIWKSERSDAVNAWLDSIETKRNAEAQSYLPPPKGTAFADNDPKRTAILNERFSECAEPSCAAHVPAASNLGWSVTDDFLPISTTSSAYLRDYMATLYDAVELYARGLHYHYEQDAANVAADGAAVVAAIKAIPAFEGKSRQIKVDANGDLLPNVAFVQVKAIEGSDDLEISDEVLWYDPIADIPHMGADGQAAPLFPNGFMAPGTTTPPVTARPVDATTPTVIDEDLTVSDGSRAAIMVVMVLVLLCVFAAAMMNFLKRNEKFIKYSSPNINNIILVGCVLCCLSTIFLGQNCLAFLWTATLGFTLSFGSLAAKTYRVHKLFNNKKMQKIKVQDSDLYKVIFVLVIVDLIILGVWTAVDPLVLTPFEYQPVTQTTSEYDAATETWTAGSVIVKHKESCDSEYSAEFSMALYGTKIMLVVFTAFLAWETKNVQIAALNDSKEIGFAVYNIMLLCLIIVGIGSALGDSPDTQYLFQAGGTLLSVFVTVCMVFGTKGYKLYTGQAEVYNSNTSTVKSSATTSGDGDSA